MFPVPYGMRPPVFPVFLVPYGMRPPMLQDPARRRAAPEGCPAPFARGQPTTSTKVPADTAAAVSAVPA